MAFSPRTNRWLVRFSVALVVLSCVAWMVGRFAPSAFCFNTGGSRPCDVPGYGSTWVTSYGFGLKVGGGNAALAWGATKSAVHSDPPLATQFSRVRPGFRLPPLVNFAPERFAGFGFTVNNSRQGGGRYGVSTPPYFVQSDVSVSVPLWFLAAVGSIAPVKYWLRRRNSARHASSPEAAESAREPVAQRRAA
jgi:hypothetical protein